LNVDSDGNEVTWAGRLFHMRAAATGNAWSLTVDRHVTGTTSVLVDAERRHIRASRSATHDGVQVQKKATKILPHLKHKNYTERLIACKLPTLHFRRIRGDMIETYKILSGKYDRSAMPTLPVASLL